MNAITGAPVMPMSEREVQLKTRLEQDIKENLEGFKKVGYALCIIRDQQLYRTEYDTFETYCREVWDLGRPRAYQLMASSEVMANLSTIVDTTENGAFQILPANEAQVRPLTILSPENQRTVWAKVIELSDKEGCRITAQLVQQCVSAFLQKKVTATVGKVRQITNTHAGIPEQVQRSFQAFLTEIQREAEEEWNQTGKKAMAEMLRELLESLESN